MMTTEERRTETHADGSTHTTTVIERDRVEPRRSGGSGILIVAILLIALVIGGYFIMQMSNSNAAKNDAVSEAASDVGAAAENVGNAAKDAADNLGQ